MNLYSLNSVQAEIGLEDNQGEISGPVEETSTLWKASLDQGGHDVKLCVAVALWCRKACDSLNTSSKHMSLWAGYVFSLGICHGHRHRGEMCLEAARILERWTSEVGIGRNIPQYNISRLPLRTRETKRRQWAHADFLVSPSTLRVLCLFPCCKVVVP